jgi:hypothetical protein
MSINMMTPCQAADSTGETAKNGLPLHPSSTVNLNQEQTFLP